MIGGIGVCVMFLGVAGMDSDAMWKPMLLALIGALMLIWEVKREAKKEHKRDKRNDNRPYFLH